MIRYFVENVQKQVIVNKDFFFLLLPLRLNLVDGAKFVYLPL